jgi:hypothetical protein
MPSFLTDVGLVWQVHFAATKAALAVHFGHCGEIVRVTLLADVATGKPKGYVKIYLFTLCQLSKTNEMKLQRQANMK